MFTWGTRWENERDKRHHTATGTMTATEEERSPQTWRNTNLCSVSFHVPILQRPVKEEIFLDD